MKALVRALRAIVTAQLLQWIENFITLTGKKLNIYTAAEICSNEVPRVIPARCGPLGPTCGSTVAQYSAD